MKDQSYILTAEKDIDDHHSHRKKVGVEFKPMASVLPVQWPDHQCDQLPDGLIALLIEHCTSIAEIIDSNPIQTWIFSGLNFRAA